MKPAGGVSGNFRPQGVKVVHKGVSNMTLAGPKDLPLIYLKQNFQRTVFGEWAARRTLALGQGPIPASTQTSRASGPSEPPLHLHLTGTRFYQHGNP